MTSIQVEKNFVSVTRKTFLDREKGTWRIRQKCYPTVHSESPLNLFCCIFQPPVIKASSLFGNEE